MKWIALFALAISLPALAQATDDSKAFQDAVHKKTLYLRGFPGDERVRWSWNGTTLVIAPSQYREITAVAVKSIKVKPGHVELKGERSALTVDDKGKPQLLGSGVRLSLTVDFPASESASVMPGLFDTLFFATPQEAMANVPLAVASSLPEPFRPRPREGKTCDCNVSTCSFDPDAAITVTHENHPRPTFTVDPEFSEEARHAKFSGNVVVALTIDEQGKPYDLWVTRPSALGLDRKAIDAAAQYRFAPATCHGAAIATTMSLEVNFQIF